MASTTRRFDERTQREQQEATIRSFDETKENIRRAIEEARREAPRQLQTLTDFQNETADAAKEIADTFLESQKDVVTSMQSAWMPMAERTGYWIGWMQPWWTGAMMPPRDLADVYAKMVSASAENFAAGTRMATNMMFAGMEAARTTTKYARENAKELSRITSNAARVIGQTTRETIRVQSEGGPTTAGVGTTATAAEEGPTRGETGAKRK